MFHKPSCAHLLLKEWHRHSSSNTYSGVVACPGLIGAIGISSLLLGLCAKNRLAGEGGTEAIHLNYSHVDDFNQAT